MKWKIHAHLARNEADFCHITAHANTVLLVTYFHKPLTVIRSLFCREQSVQYTVCLYKKTLLCVCSSASEGECLGFIARCNGQYQRGVDEVVSTKCQRRIWWLPVFLLPYKSNFSFLRPVSPLVYSQYHMVSTTLCLRDWSCWQGSLLRLELLVIWQVAGISTDWHVWTVRKCVYLFDIQTRLLQGLDQLCVI